MGPGTGSTAAVDWDEYASSYGPVEAVTAGFVPDLLDRLGEPDGRFLVDAAAGTGVVTLALAAAGARVGAVDTSPGMLAVLRRRAAERGLDGRVTAVVGDAGRLPLPDGVAAGAASNFGIIFCADPADGIAELARATRPGGPVAFTAWSEGHRNGWPALLPDDYADRLGFRLAPSPTCRWVNVEALRGTCDRAGLVDLDIVTRAADPSRYPSWEALDQAMTTPPSRALLAGVPDPARDRLVALLRERARERFGDGPVELPSEAWIVRGRSPAR